MREGKPLARYRVQVPARPCPSSRGEVHPAPADRWSPEFDAKPGRHSLAARALSILAMWIDRGFALRSSFALSRGIGATAQPPDKPRGCPISSAMPPCRLQQVLDRSGRGSSLRTGVYDAQRKCPRSLRQLSVCARPFWQGDARFASRVMAASRLNTMNWVQFGPFVTAMSKQSALRALPCRDRSGRLSQRS